MNYIRNSFIRYPGGKQRQLMCFVNLLPSKRSLTKRYVEPFVGGGAVFFALAPAHAILSDINSELIDLYLGIKNYPQEVWDIYESFPSSKEGYYKIRGWNTECLDLPTRAARTLYMNRTCFKGMWRHNLDGNFNVGYGGQDRRWAINLNNLIDASNCLTGVELRCCDFEKIIDECSDGDFVFLDPPYKPGEKDLKEAHYRFGKFEYSEHVRLANALEKATKRNVRWALTNSSHPAILDLYEECNVFPIPKGTGHKIGVISDNTGEVLIRNYEEV